MSVLTCWGYHTHFLPSWRWTPYSASAEVAIWYDDSTGTRIISTCAQLMCLCSCVRLSRWPHLPLLQPQLTTFLSSLTVLHLTFKKHSQNPALKAMWKANFFILPFYYTFHFHIKCRILFYSQYHLWGKSHWCTLILLTWFGGFLVSNLCSS